MGHPVIDNETPFAFEGIYRADEEGRPLLVTLIRATFAITGGRLVLSPEQAPVCVAGELWGEDAATSSYRFEPEIAFVKPATDVVLLGHAFAPHAGAVESEVSFQVGPVSRSARIFGDRIWVRSAGGVVMTRPLPFERIPLRWERAFGGWDRTAGTKDRPAFEPRNPVGTGFRKASGVFEEGIALPNLEDPSALIHRHGEVVAPAGFGVISANWHPRAAFGGTCDEAWQRERMPLLPRDFDRRFFNAAAPGLIAPGHLRGDERVTVTGASPSGALSFRLPGVSPPHCRVSLKNRSDVQIETRLDTVVVDADTLQVYLTFRAYVALRDGPHDVKAIAVLASGTRREVAPMGAR